MTVGELLVKLGFEYTPEDERKLKMYQDKLDRISQKIQGLGEHVAKGGQELFKQVTNIPNIVAGVAGSAIGIGIKQNKEMEKSYEWLFSRIITMAKRTAKELAKTLNLSTHQAMELQMQVYDKLGKEQDFGGPAGKLSYANRLIEYARRFSAVNPRVGMDEALQMITQFVTSQQGGWELRKLISKGRTDPKLDAEIEKLMKLSSMEYAKSGGGAKYRREALDQMMAGIPKYDPESRDLLTNLQNLDQIFKETANKIQDRMEKPFSMIIDKMSRFNKIIGISEDKFTDLTSGVGATVTSLATFMAALRVSYTVLNYLTWGGAGAGLSKIGKLGKKGLATAGTLASKFIRSPIGKLGTLGAAGWAILELMKLHPTGKKAIEEGPEAIDNYLEETVPGIWNPTKKGAMKTGQKVNELTEMITKPMDETPSFLQQKRAEEHKIKGDLQASVLQRNTINLTVEGAGDPEMVAERVYRKLNTEMMDRLPAQLNSSRIG